MEGIINAIVEGNYEYFVELVSQSGPDVCDGNGFTPLMYCIQNDRPEMADFLLEKGADVDRENALGNTALFYAVFHSRNRTDFIGKLLRAGADMNHANKSGVTPLALANTMANDRVRDFMNGWS